MERGLPEDDYDCGWDDYDYSCGDDCVDARLGQRMDPEDEGAFYIELEGEAFEEIEQLNLGSRDVNKALCAFPSMSIDDKILQFHLLLTAIIKNDLMCQIGQVQYLLMLHYFVTTLCDRSSEQDLLEATMQIRTIEKIAKTKPECQSLLYVAYQVAGYMSYKQNRFVCAIQMFNKSKEEFEKNPPTIEWTDVVLKAEDIKPENFEAEINKYVEKCTDHPGPIARCQYSYCEGYYKREIYPSDPDYRGYVKLFCDKNCKMQYHPTCWKRFKRHECGGQPNVYFCSTKTVCMNSGCEGFIVKFIIQKRGNVPCRVIEAAGPGVLPQPSAVEIEPRESSEGQGEASERQELMTVQMAKEEFHPPDVA